MNSPDNPLIRPSNPFERRMASAVAAAKPNASVGVVEKPLPGGRSLQPLRKQGLHYSGGGFNAHNWKPQRIDSDHLIINSGTINAVEATIGGTVLSLQPQLEVDDSGLVYVWIKITHTLITDDGYVTGMSISARAVESGSDVPDNAPGLLYFPLFTWMGGARQSQIMFWNMSILARDDGSRSETPEYVTWVSP